MIAKSGPSLYRLNLIRDLREREVKSEQQHRLAVILARVTGGRDDGIMAAGLLLAAFTVYFVMSFITRDGPLQGSAGTPRRASPS